MTVLVAPIEQTARDRNARARRCLLTPPPRSFPCVDFGTLSFDRPLKDYFRSVLLRSRYYNLAGAFRVYESVYIGVPVYNSATVSHRPG
jgi:hypothetical protein